MKNRTGSDEILRCSFCHKSQDAVAKLISSPSDYPRAISAMNVSQFVTRSSKTTALQPARQHSQPASKAARSEDASLTSM